MAANIKQLSYAEDLVNELAEMDTTSETYEVLTARFAYSFPIVKGWMGMMTATNADLVYHPDLKSFEQSYVDSFRNTVSEIQDLIGDLQQQQPESREVLEMINDLEVDANDGEELRELIREFSKMVAELPDSSDSPTLTALQNKMEELGEIIEI